MCKVIKGDCEKYEYPQEKGVCQKQSHTHVQWLFGILASTTLLTCGLQSGWISPMTKLLQSDESPTGAPLTDAEMSWVGSALALTATFGVGLYSFVADVYGRKVGLIAIVVPQAICWAIKLFATNSTMLIIARIFGGIPAGGCYNLVPMYVKEISQDHIRGAMVSMTILMNNFGLLLIYAMGGYLSYNTVLYIVILIPIMTSVLLMFAPESPAFLVKTGKYEEAAKTTALLRGLDEDHKEVQAEVELMRNEEIHYSSLPKITFLNIFKNKAWRLGFILSMLLIGGQAFNGTFVVMTYAWSILSSSGATVSAELQTLIIPAVMIFGSIISMATVEKLGRKVLLASMFSLTGAAMMVLATTQLLQSNGYNPPQWLPIVALAVAVWATSAGVTPMAYVVLSEMFSFQVRAKLVGCIVTYAWLMCSTQLAMYPPLSRAFGIHSMFFLFAGVNILGAVVTLFLPETKGKSVEEIERLLLAK